MGIKYKKFEPTEYVMKVKKGEVVEKGLGLSFFYNTMSTSMIVMPAVAFDASFAFDDIMTLDFQRVSVQGDISYTINDYEKTATLVNFSYSGNAKEYAAVLNEAKQKMEKRIMNLAKVYVTKFLSKKDIKEAIVFNDELAEELRVKMQEDETIREFGLQLLSISILGILAKPDTRKALEAATREEILKQQDDAIYKRRNAAIEQERIVKENEIKTKRLVQEKQAEIDAKKLSSDIALEQERSKLVDLQTENEKKQSDAKAYDSEVLLRTFAGVDIEVIKSLAASGMDSRSLIAKAFTEIGDKAEKIGVLNVSPELLESLTRK